MEQRYNQTTDLFFEEPVVYAGFWERFGAAFIDGIILWVIRFVLSFVIASSPGEFFGTLYLVNLVLNWLYSAILESGSMQATLGKRALGLKVTTTAGERISFGQATGRYFGKILSTLILLIGFFMMLWDDKKQTLHDKMAGTLVVKA